MSVNLYNATTDTLKNVAGDIINVHSVNEMVAPVEEGTTASRPYSVGEQFIIDGILYYAMTNIAQGEAFDYDVNYYESSPLAEQVDDKQNKTDLGLQTDSKTVVGAINELNDKVTPYVPSSLESATWAEISKSIEDGTLTQYAHIGDTKSFEMNGKTYHAEIVSINDGTGDAGQWYPDKTVDFICTELYETTYPYYTETAEVGGFPNSELKETLVNTLYPLLPSDLKDVIVGKTHAYNSGQGTNTATTNLWLPTHYEITGSVDMFAPEETALNNKAYTLTSKIKNLNGQSSAIAWWLGSTGNRYSYYWKVLANGNLRDDDGYLTLGIPICFRVGEDGSSLIPAKQISYDNTGTGLSSTDVQGAISELNSSLDYCIDNGVRNLFDIDGDIYVENKVTHSTNYDNGSVTLTKDSQSGGWQQTVIDILEFNPDWVGKKFTISVDSVVLSNQRLGDWRIFLNAWDNTSHTGTSTIVATLSATNGNVATGTIPTGTVALSVVFRMSQSHAGLENDTITWNKIQVEYGDEKTEYIPFAKSSALLTKALREKIIYNGFYTTQTDNQWEDTGVTFTLTKKSLVLIRLQYMNTGVRGIAVGTSNVFDYTSVAIVENSYDTSKQIVCYLPPATYHVLGRFHYANRNNGLTIISLQEFD